MRLHKHQAGRTSNWHSVRRRHDSVWDWCAHHEEVEKHLQMQRRKALSVPTHTGLKPQAAH
jgi:hypothetical protein